MRDGSKDTGDGTCNSGTRGTRGATETDRAMERLSPAVGRGSMDGEVIQAAGRVLVETMQVGRSSMDEVEAILKGIGLGQGGSNNHVGGTGDASGCRRGDGRGKDPGRRVRAILEAVHGMLIYTTLSLGAAEETCTRGHLQRATACCAVGGSGTKETAA